MRALAIGLLIFATGWGLAWYTFGHRGAAPDRAAQTGAPAVSGRVDPDTAVLMPVAPARGDNIARLLAGNEFAAVMERYEALQDQAGDAVVADARVQILAHARRLTAGRRFHLAEQLLQQFLVSAYRDVEARLLLAETYHGQQDLYAALDQLYEARGYAYRPAMLQRITTRIRFIAGELTQALKRNDDYGALLALYQHLTQLEPDFAPWFLGLATSQLALEDREAARRSLLLVAQDPDVGAQAQALLTELNLAVVELQDTASPAAVPEVAGIPLHRSGNSFIVDALPAHGRRIRLLIDTGASLTIFTPEVLEQRGIRYRDTGRTGVFNTANGRVRAPVYVIDSLAVGDWQVNGLEIGVLDLGSRAGVDGLLGMNFLNQFRFFIDQNEAVLRLSANPAGS